MGIFNRNNDENFKIQLEKEAMDKLNNQYDEDFTLPLGLSGEDSVWSIRGKAKAPHTITADELKKTKSDDKPQHDSTKENSTNIPMSSKNTGSQSPSSFLYQRMLESRNQNLENTIIKPKSTEYSVPCVEDKNNDKETKPITQPQKSEPIDIDEAIKSLKETANLKARGFDSPNFETQNKTVTPDEKNEPVKTVQAKSDSVSAEKRRTSLLARCNAYLEDEEFGTAKIYSQKYKLESVESILEGFENRAAQRVKGKFSTSTSSFSDTKSASTLKPTPTMASIKNEPKKENTSDPSIFEKPFSKIHDTDNAKLETKVSPIEVNEEKTKHIFTLPTSKPKSSDDQDFSSTIIVPDISVESKPTVALGGNTEIFTKVEKPIKELKSQIESEPYEDESDVLEPIIDDYKSISDRDKVLNSLKHSKSKLSLRAFLTFILLVISLLLITPISASLTRSGMMPIYIAEMIISFIAIVANFNIIKSISSLFKNVDDPDLPAALSVIASFIFAVVNLICDGKLLGLSAVSLFSLLVFNLTKRDFYSRTIKNFNIICNSDTKTALSIIKNKSVNKAMVGNSIEGGALVCCGVKTTNMQDFLKYTYCSNPIASIIKTIALIGLILGFGIASASMFLGSGSVAFAFANFAAVVAISAAPATLLVYNLPFKAAHGRLNLYDAMLTGYRAAEEYDLCNGIAVNCKDLFPEGTIRLVDMKLLSPNPFDQSMLDAAAICEEIGSPIAGIFTQVKTTSSYVTKKPIVDSVIYEEKMGVSGWVNDRRVFVGNRILMEAHGLRGLPPVELDKKIMRKGYFPVYLASDNIPCALLVVKYNTDQDIAYELRRLCNTGTTVLVNNCDPNISDKMLCDYFSVLEETIHIMNKQGSDQHTTFSEHKENLSAGAAYKSNSAGLFSLLTASINIKKSVSAMTVIYVIGIILGILGLGVSIFASFTSIVAPIPLLVYQLVVTAITCLPPILSRP